jgi:hypothetical protein
MSIIAIIHFVTSEIVRKDVVPALRIMTRRDWLTRCNAGRKSPRGFVHRMIDAEARRTQFDDKAREGNHGSQRDIA